MVALQMCLLHNFVVWKLQVVSTYFGQGLQRFYLVIPSLPFIDFYPNFTYVSVFILRSVWKVDL